MEAEGDIVSGEVYVYDEIVVRSAHYEALRSLYLDGYLPQAQARGMTLQGCWRSPPVDLPDREVTLHAMWLVADPGSWWAMRLDAVEDKLRWWGTVDAMVVSRKRTAMTSDGKDARDV